MWLKQIYINMVKLWKTLYSDFNCRYVTGDLKVRLVTQTPTSTLLQSAYRTHYFLYWHGVNHNVHNHQIRDCLPRTSKLRRWERWDSHTRRSELSDYSWATVFHTHTFVLPAVKTGKTLADATLMFVTWQNLLSCKFKWDLRWRLRHRDTDEL